MRTMLKSMIGATASDTISVVTDWCNDGRSELPWSGLGTFGLDSLLVSLANSLGRARNFAAVAFIKSHPEFVSIPSKLHGFGLACVKRNK